MSIKVYDNPRGRGSKFFIYKDIKYNKCLMIKDLGANSGFPEFTKGHIWTCTQQEDLDANSRKLEDWEIVKFKLLGYIEDSDL